MKPIIVNQNRKFLDQLQFPSTFFYELLVDVITYFWYVFVKGILKLTFPTTDLGHYDFQALN